MLFNDYTTLYDFTKRIRKKLGDKLNDDVEECYKQYKNFTISQLQDMTRAKDVIAAYNQSYAEIDYIQADRPYYNVYPTITKYLINLKEDKVPLNLIKLPHRAIVFRFADVEDAFDFENSGKKYRLKTVFASYTESKEIRNIDKDKPVNHDIMVLWIDVGETSTIDIGDGLNAEVPIQTYNVLHVNIPGMTLEDAIIESRNGRSTNLIIPDDAINKIIRCVASCCLISKDVDDGLIEPDVLAADRAKYLETKDQKYVEKAKRRGKNGYLVGANLTISPHWRSGSPIALYWTGPGRQTPIYRPRKGALIHRKKVKQLPTGYAGK